MQLHRETKRWEDQENLKTKRYVYGGKDELTGETFDQLYPINDTMCVKCAQKYRSKSFVKKATMTQKSGLCPFCGTYYDFSTNFLQVSFYAGRTTLKRYSRLDQYENTVKAADTAKSRTEKMIKDKARQFT